MIGWVFAGITLSAVVMASFVNHMRRAILALWVAGLGVGAIYLTIGAEFLAIVQWIVSTLVAISFIFFSVMFGEFHGPAPRGNGNAILLTFLSISIGVGFTIVIGLGCRGLIHSSLNLVSAGTDLAQVGRVLTQDHLLSLDILALILFLVLVGGGVVARSEGGDST